ncbi:MAG: rhodanese-like domain-containing protein [Nitrospirota bacterium]|nr:rhodanese-like domain-containing protein [Nitrospirota bacterium]
MNPADIQRSCQQIKQRLESGDALFLLDVREPPERAFNSIDGSVHIPMGEIPHRLRELDPDKEIVVYCHHGVRSFQVAAYLKANGFGQVYNLAGGIDAWSVSVDPAIPRYN